MLLQELGITNTCLTPSANQYNQFFPSKYRPKSAISVRKEYNSQQKIIMTSGDHTISIGVNIGGHRVEIINTYTPNKKETKDALLDHHPLPNCLLGGYFNKHHANWYGPIAPNRAKIIGKCTPSASFMVNWTEAQGLLLLNKPGQLTHFPRNGSSTTIPDATFASSTMHDAFQIWSANYGASGDSNHALITTSLHISSLAFKSCSQFHRIHWSIVGQYFVKTPPLISTPDEAIVAAAKLSRNFEAAIAAVTPWSRPNQKSKIWWTPEISALKSSLNAAKKRVQQDLTNEAAEEHQKECGRRWRSAIRKAQWDHWDRTMRSAVRETAYKAIKSSSKRRPQMDIPDIQGTRSFQGECDILRDSFFTANVPLPPPTAGRLPTPNRKRP